ncbi:unnamed protein product [Schistosoma curassoni]|uniref:DUF6451 domain-containing protein n=1 Tax=Schistosoma curassoni TaxID=6186 RepID=A0A183JH86_9TREM|nr:unnamed protein product [Schistosoma curassoni]
MSLSNEQKGITLEEMSKIIQQLNNRINTKRTQLAPIIRELRQLRQRAQMKANSVEEASASVGLHIHKRQSNILQYNTENTNSFTFDGETLKEVESFTYLGDIIDERGGSDSDVKARIDKARTAFLQLNKMCNSKQLSTSINVRIFNTNVNTVLLYGAETWKTITIIVKKYN